LGSFYEFTEPATPITGGSFFFFAIVETIPAFPCCIHAANLRRKYEKNASNKLIFRGVLVNV
jgi:hypothetical protein